MTTASIVRDLLSAGRTKMQIAAELRLIHPGANPGYLRRAVERVIQDDRKAGRPDCRWQPDAASTG